MVLFNGLNYCEHLLIMSLNVQQYKLVGRSFINQMLSNQKSVSVGVNTAIEFKKLRKS